MQNNNYSTIYPIDITNYFIRNKIEHQQVASK